MTRRSILVTNDDGYQAKGIIALAEALARIADVTVVAPDRDRSGASRSLTLDRPLRVGTAANGYRYINGTPADCAHIALTALLDRRPDMVVSGINSHANLGDDVFYSGTVAAAMEAAFMDVPSIAVSLANVGNERFDTAAHIAVELVEKVGDRLGADTVLNVNVPDIDVAALKGYAIGRLGNRHKAEPATAQADPRGNPIYWIGPPGPEADAGPGTDFDAVRSGYVSVTPVNVDLTQYAAFERTSDLLGLGTVAGTAAD